MKVVEKTRLRSLWGRFFLSLKNETQILDLAPSLGWVMILQTPQCCSFVHILMCFTAQNRSYIVVLLEHFMNLKSFIWNWSLNDFFYLPSLLVIPFICLSENKDQGCHISRFQWTTHHFKVQRMNLISGTWEGSSS